MTALLIGMLLLLAAVYLVLPVDWSPQWGYSVLEFIKGGVPLAAFLVGLLAVFIGITDIKDRLEAKKEEQNVSSEEQKEPENP